jgi:exodeoxyribonuclease VII large subunit
VLVRSELIDSVAGLGLRQRQALRRGMVSLRDRLRAASRGLPRPADLMASARQRLDLAANRLAAGLAAAASVKSVALARLETRLAPRLLIRQTALLRDRLADRAGRLVPAVRRLLTRNVEHLTGLDKLLASLGHKSVLARGFALVTGADGRLVRTAAALVAGERIAIGFADGSRDAVIDGGGPAAPARRPKPAPKKPGSDGQSSLF